MAENEALRRVQPIRAPRMVRTLALVAAALLGPCEGAAITDRNDRLRGQHRHRRHVSIMDAESEVANMAPLYDDFLDIMNNAAAKALEQQRAIPAYDDFLHFMKAESEKAYKEQRGVPGYDDFLGFVKGKSDEAYRQSVGTPSYEDFLSALKESSDVALKVPVPTYEEFLSTLKDAAERAMHKRMQHAVAEDSIKLSSGDLDSEGSPLAEALASNHGDNPLTRVVDRVRKQMKGEPERGEDEESKLRKELEELQRKKREHKKKHGDVPEHVHRPLMARINVLRTQLCWKRPNLWQHEKCLRFLGLHCLQESTGEGICRAFTKKAKEKCGASTDKRWKEDYCALAEALSEEYEEEEEAEEALEKAEEKSQADMDKGAVGSDEDLDEELDKMDKKLAEDEAAPASNDRDGDGVPDDQDAFPDDPSEHKDTDGDGIGDNADNDIDGDGKPNEVDAFPSDPKEWKDTDGDGIGDNADDDRDNDGVANKDDKFPEDPTEWLDTDGDGVGDNSDAFPLNPNCHSHTQPCEEAKSVTPKPGSQADPAMLNKDGERALPAQGYNEHMNGPPVKHENYYTYVGDWQGEFPEMTHSEEVTMDKICKEHPDNSWCKRFANDDTHFR